MNTMSESKTDELLKAAYYRPGGYQGAAKLQLYIAQNNPKGVAAPSLPVIRKWLAKQQLVQMHQQKAPAAVSKPDLRTSHFTGLKLNDLHMIDLLTMPKDDGYCYILSMIDCATRFKAAKPLATKLAAAVAVAIREVYSDEKSPLTWPKNLNVDAGSEFKGEVAKMYAEHKTNVRVSEPGHHTSQAFVESMNKALAQRLFKAQEAKEMTSGKKNTEWVDELPAFIKSMNSEKTRLLGCSPNHAVAMARKDRTVEPSGFTTTAAAKKQIRDAAPMKEKLLPQGKYRVRTLVDRPEEGGPRRRATDAQWSTTTHTIDRVVVDSKGVHPTLYYMSKMKHGLPRQDLQPVSEIVKPPALAIKAPRPPPAKKKAAPKPKYRAAQKTDRELISGMPVSVSSRGRVIRAS